MPTRSAQDIWQTALRRLNEQVSATAYQTWLSDTHGLSYADNEFVVGVPNDFTHHWLQGSLLPIMERAVSEVLQEQARITIQVTPQNSAADDDGEQMPAQVPVLAEESAQGSSRSRGGRSYAIGARPDPKLTFDQFVVGDNTKLAYAAATNVANNPSRQYNPLVLFGPPGLGKTHLLHAIANETQGHQRPTLLATAEQFVHDYVTSVQEKTISKFRELYRSPDILVLDDIQFICGKVKSEEALLYTCNALIRSGHQVVISADRAPDALPFTHELLATRLRSGLPVDLKPPDRKTRLNILAFKSSRSETDVPDEVLHYLAARPYASVSQMEGELTKIIAHSTLLGQDITLELAQNALTPTLAGAKSLELTPEALILAVAAYYELSPEALRSKSRERSVTTARQVAMYLSRHHTSASLAQIGRFLGNRDHTTVIHGVERITRLVSTDSRLQATAEAIIQIASSPLHRR